MDVIFYAGPWDGQFMKATYTPIIGDVVSAGGERQYIYAGKGRFVFMETAEADEVRKYVKTHGRK